MTAGRPLARATARERSSTDSTREVPDLDERLVGELRLQREREGAPPSPSGVRDHVQLDRIRPVLPLLGTKAL